MMEMVVVTDGFPSWNGSFLGVFPESCIVDFSKSHPCNFYKVIIHDLNKTDGIVFWSAMRRSKNKASSIIDEIKPIFGLPKIGTHSVCFGSTMYTMYRIDTQPILLKDYTGVVDAIFHKYVQYTFIFRLICGLNNNFETSIAVIDGIPVSYRDTINIRNIDHLNLPVILVNKWFNGSMSALTAEMLNRAGGTAIIRKHIQLIIGRIDRELIWMDNAIFQRIIALC